MCDMPIPFGTEFDASAPGPFEQSSRVNEDPKSPQIEPIRSAYVPRSNTNVHSSIYHPPRKSPQASESLQTFSYYPGPYPASSSSLPQQEYYFTGSDASNPQNMQLIYGRQPSTNYQLHQQLPYYQYQPVQLKPTAEQYPVFQNPGMIDPSFPANGPYDMRRNSNQGTCEKCGSFCSSNSYNPNFMAAMMNSEPTQRFAQFGVNSETNPSSSRPYRFYYPPSPSNRKYRDNIRF